MRLEIDLKGKKALVAGIGDDQGFAFWIAKALYQAGCEVIAAVWPPMYNIFKQSIETGKYDESLLFSDGSKLAFLAIYPLDAAYDSMEDVPLEIKENKRYKEHASFSIKEFSQHLLENHGEIDIVIHSIANAPEIKSPLSDTSRKGYLAAISNSTYSFISLAHHFKDKMNQNGSFITLTYDASNRVIPGYGGGMSSAKAALESDIRTLAFELGQSHGHRLNAVSAGPYASRAARAIGNIHEMIHYSEKNAPLPHHLEASDVANMVTFLSSDLAKAVTGQTIYVDMGLSIMGRALDMKTDNHS